MHLLGSMRQGVVLLFCVPSADSSVCKLSELADLNVFADGRFINQIRRMFLLIRTSQIKQSNVEVNLMLYYVESGQLVAFV